jgi:hypothetical protein
MTHPDIEYMLMMERRRDDLAAAAHYRMVKEALRGKREQANQPRHTLFSRLSENLTLWLAHFLSLAGERMLTWSCRLQYRRALLTEDGAEPQPAPCT